jgi:DNA-directed RNA polymerase III subunit RPC4
MTASGPFAMGPSLAGSSSRRSTPRSNFAPIFPLGPSEKFVSGLTQTAAPSLKKEKDQFKSSSIDDDAEVYSEPDEGVEIVDMDDIKKMDWMAPETLLKEPEDKKRRKKEIKIKKEEFTALSNGI